MYVINVIAHSLKGDKVAKYGDVVASKQLEGNVEDLLKAGFIRKLTKKESDAFKSESKAAQEAAKKAAEEKAKQDTVKK